MLNFDRIENKYNQDEWPDNNRKMQTQTVKKHNKTSLLRLVSAIEMEISEDWIAGKRYLDMTVKMEN